MCPHTTFLMLSLCKDEFKTKAEIIALPIVKSLSGKLTTRFSFYKKCLYNMRLKLRKNQVKFKKHRQAEIQIITCKNCFTSKFLSNLQENRMSIHYMPQEI